MRTTTMTLTLLTLFLTTALAAPKPHGVHAEIGAIDQVSTALVPTPTPPTVTISPSPLLPSPTSPPTLAGVYVCEHVNWGGACNRYYNPTGTGDSDCKQLDGTASSIGPDEGFQCFFYTNGFCRPMDAQGMDWIKLEYPGNANLGVTAKGDFNDKIRSYQCLKV